MDDKNARNPASGAGYVHGYSPWAPSGLVGGMNASGLVSALAGVLAVVLAILSTLSGVAWLAALLAVVCGLRLLMPRATTAQRVMCGAGLGTGSTAIVLLLV
jgi:hypothetical protein